MSGRLLAIDYGSRRIGLAVSDGDRKFAFPLALYERRTPELDASYFRNLMTTEDISQIVLGLPVHLNGHEGQKAGEVRRFGAWLAQTIAVPIVYFDERFTTVEAESALWDAGLTHRQRKQRRDKVAAQILLQTYLDADCPENPTTRALDE